MATLTVSELSYEPPMDLMQEAQSFTQRMLDSYVPENIAKKMPHFVSERSAHTHINKVSFVCKTGELNVVMTKSSAERKTILELIANRRYAGTFDGDVSVVLNAMSSKALNSTSKRAPTYDDQVAYVHRKALFVPGLTFEAFVMYAARLRMGHSHTHEQIKTRVADVMSMMDLMHCRHRKIEESPSLRGVSGGELRRLSIACEIVALPPVLLFEDPIHTLEPGVGHAVMACIKVLATRGHIVICAMDTVTAPLLPLVNQLIVVADGYSIYANTPASIQEYFCSPEMGYVFNPRGGAHGGVTTQHTVVDFVSDIATGVERSTQSRIPESAHVLYHKFMSSGYNMVTEVPSRGVQAALPIEAGVGGGDPESLKLGTQSSFKASPLSSGGDTVVRSPLGGGTALRGLPQTTYFNDKWMLLKSLFGCKAPAGVDAPTTSVPEIFSNLYIWLYRCYLIIERAVFIKLSDTQLILAGLISSIVVGTIVGYLQYNCGHYGYYSMTFVGFPYVGTANTTAVIFFISAFTIAQQALNCHLVCQSLQLFRYEQFTGVCPTLGYILGFLFSEVPIVSVNITVFSTIVFFMTKMSFGVGNYLYFVEVLVLNALIGVFTAYLVAVLLKREIPVRDAYLAIVFGMVILSGFPFQLPYIRSYMNDISQINPMRWTFEAIMNWKFSFFEDGEYYLIPFDFGAFHHMEIFQIQLTFLLQSGFTTFALLLPWPYLLTRKGGNGDGSGAGGKSAHEQGERVLSVDSDFGVEANDVVRNSVFTNLKYDPNDGANNAGGAIPRQTTNPLLFSGPGTNNANNLTKRLSESPAGRLSDTNAYGRASDSSTGGTPGGAAGEGFTRTSLVRPHLFNRETSITAKSALSINISQTSIQNSLTAFNSPHSTGPGIVGGKAGAGGAGTGVTGGDPKEALLKESRGPTVEFHNLNYSVKDAFAPLGVKKVLQNVSGQFDWGKLSMILGASHSGRSSLLHILAGDSGLSTEVTGEILFDSVAPNTKIPLWERCALVEAQDEQIRDITVRDAITYSMMLRCPMRSLMSIAQSNVHKTIALLHLDTIAHKKCKSISKGQRRRLSIAEEIVGGPGLLLIDEPTTEVEDEHEVSILLQCFRELVNQDRTVVCAMHKPSEPVFHLFDTVLLLSKGQVIFFGDVNEAVPYFTTRLPSNQNFTIGNIKNPADFLIDISGGYAANTNGDLPLPSLLAGYFQDDIIKRMGGGRRTTSLTLPGQSTPTNTPPQAQGSSKVLDTLVPTFTPLNELSGVVAHGDSNSHVNSTDNGSTGASGFFNRILNCLCPPILGALALSTFHFMTACLNCNLSKTFIVCEVILVRSFQSMWNRKKLMLACVILHVLMACFLGWVLGPSSDQAYNLTSFFAIATLMLYFANLQLVYFMFTTHAVFLKEHSRGLYGTFEYWALSQFPVYLLKSVSAVVFSVIAFALLAMGLNREIEGFFILTMLASVLGGHMVTEWIVFMIRDIRAAYIMLPVMYFLFFAFSGLFIKASALPGWMAPWAPSFSLIRWVMQAEFINYFEGDTAVFPSLPFIDTYTQFLQLFGWGGKSKWYCLYMIVAQVAVYKTLALCSAAYSAINQRGGRHNKRRVEHG